MFTNTCLSLDRESGHYHVVCVFIEQLVRQPSAKRQQTEGAAIASLDGPELQQVLQFF